MKKIIIILILFVSAIQKAVPQSMLLPEGKSQIVLKNGKVIHTVKLWRIHGMLLEYEASGNLHDVYLEKIKIIENNNDEYEIANNNIRKRSQPDSMLHTPTTVAAVPDETYAPNSTSTNLISDTASSTVAIHNIDSGTYFYELGRTDAKTYYNGTGAFIGGMIPYAAPVVAMIPQKNPGKNNVNASLFYSDKNYRQGFKNAAHGKKALNVLGGFFTSLVIVFALASAAQ